MQQQQQQQPPQEQQGPSVTASRENRSRRQFFGYGTRLLLLSSALVFVPPSTPYSHYRYTLSLVCSAACILVALCPPLLSISTSTSVTVVDCSPPLAVVAAAAARIPLPPHPPFHREGRPTQPRVLGERQRARQPGTGRDARDARRHTIRVSPFTSLLHLTSYPPTPHSHSTPRPPVLLFFIQANRLRAKVCLCTLSNFIGSGVLVGVGRCLVLAPAVATKREREGKTLLLTTGPSPSFSHNTHLTPHLVCLPVPTIFLYRTLSLFKRALYSSSPSQPLLLAFAQR